MVADLVAVVPLEVSRMTGYGGIDKISTVFLFTKLQKILQRQPLRNGCLCSICGWIGDGYLVIRIRSL